MKEKILYTLGTFILVCAAFFGLQNVESGSMFGASGGGSRSLSLEMTMAPESVNITMAELRSVRPHLSETCIYGAAMLLNDMGDDAKTILDREGKCIHTLVLFIAREQKVAHQLKLDAAKIADAGLETNE